MRALLIAAMAAIVIGLSSAASAQGLGTTAIRPPFRLDQLVPGTARSFPCNPTLAGGNLQSCLLGSGFSFSGLTASVDLGFRTITTTNCITGGGDLGVDRTFSLSTNCIGYGLIGQAPGNTIVGNPNAGTGNLVNMTASQAAALLPVFGGDSGSGGLKGLVPPTAAGDGAAGKVLLATGGWGAVPATGSFANATITNPTISGGTINGTAITGVPNPVNAGDAVNLLTLQSVAAGLAVHTQVTVATAAVLPNTPTYANGSSGVGATLTAGANTALVVDGQTVSSVGTRVLVKNQAAPSQNGIYTLTQAGSGSVPWILTRATDFDAASSSEVIAGAYVFVTTGTANAQSGWQMNTTGSITVGSTSLGWVQFLGSTAYTAGSGLSLTGSQFALSTPVSATNGGTGVNNGSNTLTLGGALTTSGAFASTFTFTGTTGVTFPPNGTLWSTTTVNSGSACNGGNFLQYGGSSFSCAAAPTAQNIAINAPFTITPGVDNAGPLVPGASTLYFQSFPKVYTADRTLDVTNMERDNVANGSTAIIFTLPVATATTGQPGSTGRYACFGDQAGNGFTLSATTTFIGMVDVTGNSYTFTPRSVVCATSTGSAWKLSGIHGKIPTTQFPTTGVTPAQYTNPTITTDATGRITAIANGSSSGLPTISSPRVLGNFTGAAAPATESTLAMGSGLASAVSAGTLTIGSSVSIDTQSANSAFAIPSAEGGKTLLRGNTVAQTDTLPVASTSGYGSGFGFEYFTGSARNTIAPTTSTIGGLSSLTFGARQFGYIVSDGTNYRASLGVPVPTSQTGLNCLHDDMQWSGCGGSGGVNVQTATSYTLQASDCGKTLLLNNASPITVTTLNTLAVGCEIKAIQQGAGQVFVNNGAAASLDSAQGFNTTNRQWSVASLFVDSNSNGSAAHYVLFGDVGCGGPPPNGNLVSGGNGLATWAPQGTATLTSSQAGDPCGTSTAATLVENTTSGDHFMESPSITFTANTTYTCDLYIKPLGTGAARNVLIYISTTDFNNAVFSLFRGSDGAVQSTLGVGTATLVSTNSTAIGGWFRVGATFNMGASTGTHFYAFLANGTTLGSQTYTGDGASGLFFWGPSCRVGTVP